jgi:hypothetical protein
MAGCKVAYGVEGHMIYRVEESSYFCPCLLGDVDQMVEIDLVVSLQSVECKWA